MRAECAQGVRRCEPSGQWSGCQGESGIGDETCDGIDNDCNGIVDDVVQPPTWYVDTDGDGYGNEVDGVQACDAPPGRVAMSGDCNDADEWVNPGRSELCDGLDNDCNPATSELCVSRCEPRTRDGRVYLFCEADASWSDAQRVCNAEGMRMTRVDDEAENQWIRETANNVNRNDDDIWIGASDTSAESMWVWEDGTIFWQGGSRGQAVGGAFTRWDGGEPNDDGTEDCAEMGADGRWNDAPCGVENEFVCERY